MDAWTQLHQTWPGHRAIISALQFCFTVLILCCICKCGRLKGEWCFERRQISHFLTSCENCGRGGRYPYTNCWSFTYDRTFEIHLMAVLCVAAERGGLVKKKEMKVHGLNFKAFPTKVGRPNEKTICHQVSKSWFAYTRRQMGQNRRETPQMCRVAFMTVQTDIGLYSSAAAETCWVTGCCQRSADCRLFH